MNNQQITLVTGAASSGKSEWAEHLAAKTGKQVFYVATSRVDPNDGEWQARITRHIQRRPASWQTLFVPVDLAATIEAAQEDSCLLVDSLGTWLANLLEQDEQSWQQVTRQLLTSLETTAAQIIFVAEETGWGIVPAYESGRLFRDRLGKLTRQIGTISGTVYLVAGGHVLNLSKLGEPLP